MKSLCRHSPPICTINHHFEARVGTHQVRREANLAPQRGGCANGVDLWYIPLIFHALEANMHIAKQIQDRDVPPLENVMSLSDVSRGFQWTFHYTRALSVVTKGNDNGNTLGASRLKSMRIEKIKSLQMSSDTFWHLVPVKRSRRNHWKGISIDVVRT